ncbi:MAG: DUF5615 family PIN-like protein [Egibacteraceae bacterium]
MKLLLDVHFTPVIAEQLRDRGHAVRSAADDTVTRQLSDEALLGHAVGHASALLTNDAKDFVPIAGEWARAGRRHLGIVLTSDRRLPRTRTAIGRFVITLDALLSQHPDDEALRDRLIWLKP